jgi:hypothetical protein
MTRSLRHFGLVAAWLLASSCGGSRGGPGAVQSPFLPEDEALFDGGVEFVDDPEKLTGRWRADWESELAARVARADVVLVGEVVATRHGADGEGSAFHDLKIEVDDVLVGSIDESIELRSLARDPGHRTLARAGDRLLGGKYVAFLKWAEEDGKVRGRFHLAHASGFVLSAVKFQLGKRKR